MQLIWEWKVFQCLQLWPWYLLNSVNTGGSRWYESFYFPDPSALHESICFSFQRTETRWAWTGAISETRIVTVSYQSRSVHQQMNNFFEMRRRMAFSAALNVMVSPCLCPQIFPKMERQSHSTGEGRSPYLPHSCEWWRRDVANDSLLFIYFVKDSDWDF